MLLDYLNYSTITYTFLTKKHIKFIWYSSYIEKLFLEIADPSFVKEVTNFRRIFWWNLQNFALLKMYFILET